MYIYLGSDVVVPEEEIVGIFDIDKTTTTGETRNFLSHYGMIGNSITISDEMPKSFIIVKNKDKENKIYISPISTSTLKLRCNNG